MNLANLSTRMKCGQLTEVKHCKLSLLQAFFQRIERATCRRAKMSLKKDGVSSLLQCNFCPVGLRILPTTGFRIGKCFRYARLFSVLKYNFCPIHSSVNLIAMFVSEIRETHCRYPGSMSKISVHATFARICSTRIYSWTRTLQDSLVANVKALSRPNCADKNSKDSE